jgi:hypothetical protein
VSAHTYVPQKIVADVTNGSPSATPDQSASSVRRLADLANSERETETTSPREGRGAGSGDRDNSINSPPVYRCSKPASVTHVATPATGLFFKGDHNGASAASRDLPRGHGLVGGDLSVTNQDSGVPDQTPRSATTSHTIKRQPGDADTARQRPWAPTPPVCGACAGTGRNAHFLGRCRHCNGGTP